MITKERIFELAQKKAFDMDCFLVDIKISKTNDITVLFDKSEGVFLNDCLEMSRYIENNLDREIEDFQLLVSSPGLNNPFVVKEQYIKNIGKEIVVQLKDGEKITGKCIAFDGNIVLETSKKEKGKKQIKKQKKIISVEEVKETKVSINF